MALRFLPVDPSDEANIDAAIAEANADPEVLGILMQNGDCTITLGEPGVDSNMKEVLPKTHSVFARFVMTRPYYVRWGVGTYTLNWHVTHPGNQNTEPLMRLLYCDCGPGVQVIGAGVDATVFSLTPINGTEIIRGDEFEDSGNGVGLVQGANAVRGSVFGNWTQVGIPGAALINDMSGRNKLLPVKHLDAPVGVNDGLHRARPGDFIMLGEATLRDDWRSGQFVYTGDTVGGVPTFLIGGFARAAPDGTGWRGDNPVDVRASSGPGENIHFHGFASDHPAGKIQNGSGQGEGNRNACFRDINHGGDFYIRRSTHCPVSGMLRGGSLVLQGAQSTELDLTIENGGMSLSAFQERRTRGVTGVVRFDGTPEYAQGSGREVIDVSQCDQVRLCIIARNFGADAVVLPWGDVTGQNVDKGDGMIATNNVVYIAETTGVAGGAEPTHQTGVASDGGVTWRAHCLPWLGGETSIPLYAFRHHDDKVYMTERTGDASGTPPIHRHGYVRLGNIEWRLVGWIRRRHRTEAVTAGEKRITSEGKIYAATESGNAASPEPTHNDGFADDGGGVEWWFRGYSPKYWLRSRDSTMLRRDVEITGSFEALGGLDALAVLHEGEITLTGVDFRHPTGDGVAVQVGLGSDGGGRVILDRCRFHAARPIAMDNSFGNIGWPGVSELGDADFISNGPHEHLPAQLSGAPTWAQGLTVSAGDEAEMSNGIVYTADAAGTTGATEPTHPSGSASDGGVSWTATRVHRENYSRKGCILRGEDQPTAVARAYMRFTEWPVAFEGATTAVDRAGVDPAFADKSP